MNVEEFSEQMKILLKPIYLDKGEVIYSKSSTFKKGKYYLIGLNPGCFNNDDFTVGKCVEGFVNDQNNPNYYIDTLGELNKNVSQLFSKDYFNYNFEKVFTTNLIFTTTKNSNEIKSYKRLVDICWPVHQLALKEVNPEVIICIGNGYRSSYAKFHKEFSTSNEIWKRRVFGTFSVKIEEISFENDSKKHLLIGLPHLSWIKDFDKSLGSIIRDLMVKYYTYFIEGE